MRERLVLEIADREFDDGVLAVFGLDHGERIGAVGQEGKQLPGRQQLALTIQRADAADTSRRPFRVVSAICAMLAGG